jgi:hypothetical protein
MDTPLTEDDNEGSEKVRLFFHFLRFGFQFAFIHKTVLCSALDVLVIGVHQGDLHEPLLENISQDLVERSPKLFMVTESFPVDPHGSVPWRSTRLFL